MLGKMVEPTHGLGLICRLAKQLATSSSRQLKASVEEVQSNSGLEETHEVCSLPNSWRKKREKTEVLEKQPLRISAESWKTR
jgi:hypothetical protein